MLAARLIAHRVEAGCDEAGRGPLAGPVVAAAVILPEGYRNAVLNDSKQLSEHQRNTLRTEIEREADAWAVATVSASDIDRMNILHASTHAMSLAALALLGDAGPGVTCGGQRLGAIRPEHLVVDGNRFYNETPIDYTCVVGGDARLLHVAAASVLAKTNRDELMLRLHNEYPFYGWDHNKGYPTADHYRAIEQHGISPYHRRSFTLYKQHTLFE